MQIYYSIYYIFLNLKQNKKDEILLSQISWDQYYPYPQSSIIDACIDENTNLKLETIKNQEMLVLNIKENISIDIDDYVSNLIDSMSIKQIIDYLSIAKEECIKLEDLVYVTDEDDF